MSVSLVPSANGAGGWVFGFGLVERKGGKETEGPVEMRRRRRRMTMMMMMMMRRRRRRRRSMLTRMRMSVVMMMMMMMLMLMFAIQAQYMEVEVIKDRHVVRCPIACMDMYGQFEYIGFDNVTSTQMVVDTYGEILKQSAGQCPWKMPRFHKISILDKLYTCC